MYEVWEDRPKLEASEVVKSGGIFNQCIDFLKDQDQILHTCLGEDNSKIDFIFHEARDEGLDGRLDELQRISVDRKHFRFGLVAKNYSGRPIKNKMIFVVFANGCNKTPSKTIIFKRSDENSPWQQPQEYPLECEGNFSEVFRNAFIIPTRKNGNCLMIFRDEHTFVFDENMQEVTRVNYQNDRIKVLIQNYITAPDYNTLKSNGSTWMMTF